MTPSIAEDSRPLSPEGHTDRLPRLLDEARAAAADYLDATLDRLDDPADGGDAQSLRRAVEDKLTTATETLHRAQREPRRGRSLTGARTLDALRRLVMQLNAIGAPSAPASSPVPHLADYRRHATEALRTTSVSDAAAEITALDAVVDRLRDHLHALHAARFDEVRDRPDSETPLRETIRNQQPVITQLTRIADTVNALAAEPASARSQSDN